MGQATGAKAITVEEIAKEGEPTKMVEPPALDLLPSGCHMGQLALLVWGFSWKCC